MEYVKNRNESRRIKVKVVELQLIPILPEKVSLLRKLLHMVH
jgi:hypothetical protein